MKKNAKSLVLCSILILPVLAFFFLKGCGSNEYKLPVMFAYDSVFQDGKYILTDVHTIPDFILPSHTGDSLSLNDVKGKVFIADFFFTRCPGICPQMTTELTRVQEAFRENAEISIVSFSVDPVYDNIEVLKNYAEEYGAIAGKWHFVTGEKEDVYNLAQKGFFVSAMEDEGHIEEFIHSEKLILVDKEGRIRGYYNGTEREDVDRLITEINILLYEYNKNK
ncbi:MAG: SCO family protein [Cytophagaceae bacterium]